MPEKHKSCFKCGENKQLSAFYKHEGMLDGHLNKCKECSKKDVRKNRRSNIDYYMEYDKQKYLKKPDKQRRSSYQLERNKISPNKKRATSAINNAVRDRKMFRPNVCEFCGKLCKPHAHHSSYSEDMFLLVTWLCASCHLTLHKHFEFNIEENL